MVPLNPRHLLDFRLRGCAGILFSCYIPAYNWPSTSSLLCWNLDLTNFLGWMSVASTTNMFETNEILTEKRRATVVVATWVGNFAQQKIWSIYWRVSDHDRSADVCDWMSTDRIPTHWMPTDQLLNGRIQAAWWETDQMWADQMSIDVKLMQWTTLQQSRSLEKFLAQPSNRMLFQLQGL